MPEQLASIERFLFAGQLILAMLAMGACHKPRDFWMVFARPRSLLFGVVCQFVLVPLLAVATVRIANLDEKLALGLFLVAAMPGGPMSALFTHLGGGNAALAVSLTLFTTVASLVTTPVLLWLMSSQSLESGVIPADVVFREIGLYLIVPLVSGMIVARLTPLGPFLVRWGVRVATALLAFYVFAALTSGRIQPGSFGWGPPIAIILFCVIAQQFSMAPFRIFGWPRGDRLAVGVEMTVRDLNLALLLKTSVPTELSVREDDPALYAILFYGGTSLVVALMAVAVFRLTGRRLKANADRSAAPPSPTA